VYIDSAIKKKQLKILLEQIWEREQNHEGEGIFLSYREDELILNLSYFVIF